MIVSRRRSRLSLSFPAIGPWTGAALWFPHRIAELPATSLADEVDLICEQKLAANLLAFLDSHGHYVDADLDATIRRSAFAWTRTTVSANLLVHPALELLAAREVPFVVTKGPSIAGIYADPARRPYSDVDVLVPASRFTAMERELEGAGWVEEPRNYQPWPQFRRLCREGLNLVHRTTGSRIDLHHRIAPWLWSGRLTSRALAHPAAPCRIGARTYPGLSAAENLLVTALHVVSDRNVPGQNLFAWRDVVECARVAPIEDIVAASVGAGLSGWVRAILQALPADVRPEALLAALPRQPIAHSVRLHVLLGRRVASIGVAASQFLRLPMGNGIVFLAGLAVPSRQFLASRYPGARHPYLQWWRGTTGRQYVLDQDGTRPSADASITAR